jgi:hypothetical protein
VTAASIEEGGSTVAIFGCCQSMGTCSKEMLLDLYVQESEYKADQQHDARCLSSINRHLNGSAAHMRCGCQAR